MLDQLSYGLDFGTSNSAIAVLVNGQAQVLPIGVNNNQIISSVLFFPENEKRHYVGSAAISRYVDGGMQGRLMQSIKSFLPDSSFVGSVIKGFGFLTLEELIALILSDIKVKADKLVGFDIKEVVIGRPALFSNSKEQDMIAENRLKVAAHKAGFEVIHFQKEPIAAALHYLKSISRPELVLVADLGGGTSDFTLVKLGSCQSFEENPAVDILGVSGVYVGGNDFDSEIMWHKLVKYFGAHVQYKSWQQWLPMPVHLMRLLCTWHRVPLLKDNRTREFLKRLLSTSDDPESIARLHALIEKNLGFSLFQAIEQAKCGLSIKEVETIQFHQSVIKINEPIEKVEFESMIFQKIDAINSCISSLLFDADLEVSDVDSVFLTGGSSYVPCVKKILSDRFGIHKVKTGDVFTSVVSGLVLSSRLF